MKNLMNGLRCAGVALGMGLAIAPLHTAQAETVTTVYYVCDGGETFRAEYFTDMARVAFEPGQDPISLMQVEAASGARYEGETITLFTQDEEAFVEIDESVAYRDCTARFIGQSEIIDVESVSETAVIEAAPAPRFNRPVLTQQTQPVTPAPAPAPAQAPAATPAPAPAPAPVPGLW